MEHFDYIIVGAGFWGLCAAHTFLSIEPSLRLVIIDNKASIGGVWARDQLYPGLRTNNLQGYYEFSDFPILDAGLGVQPRGVLTGETIHAYLNLYAERFGLLPRIRLMTEVVGAAENPDPGNGWTLELRSLREQGRSESSSSKITCDKLVVATGQVSTPHPIPFRGLDAFKKPAFHSHDLGRRANALLNDDAVKDVTVVGGSKSGHDAVYLFASSGKRVTWLLHEPGRGRRPVPMGKSYLRIGSWSIWVEGLLMYRPLSWLGPAPWSDGDGAGWIRWFLHSTRLGNWLIEAYMTRMAKMGGAQSGILATEKTRLLLPDATMLWYATQRNVLNYPTDFYQLVHDGKVDIVRGEIDHLEGDCVVLENQTSMKCDALVCAIGYDYSATVPLEPERNRLSWGCPVERSEDKTYSELEARADREILTRFPMLRHSPSQPERGPSLTPWRLWRFLAPPCQVPPGRTRNLVFLNAITAFQTAIKTELTSLWAYAYLNDQLAIPSPSDAETQYEVALWTRFGKWRVPFGMQGKMADFFLDAMPYYDRLLRDLGLRSWRKGWGWFGEVLGGPYTMRDWSGVVEEWKQRQRRMGTDQTKKKER